MTSIRFSPNSNQAHRIEWLPWARSTFDRAQHEDKPVLLSVSASWCHWCHEMDETTYSDPDVQSLLSSHFLAVRVDNDHRPDINARYNVGGWPTTAFLTPHGGLIGGATFLPPDQFIAMLTELQDAYRADKPQLYSQSRDLLRQRREHARRTAAGPEVESSLVDRVSRVMAGSYDARHGGFGSEPKFPNPQILRFVTHLYRTTGEEFYAAMLRRSLDGLADSALHDSIEGGFFRYSSTADWSEPQLEKLLEDNVLLARAYLDAAIVLEEAQYRLIAEDTFKFLVDRLYDAETGASAAARVPIQTISRWTPMPELGHFRHPSIPAVTLGLARWLPLLFSTPPGSWADRTLGRIGLDLLDHIDGKADTGDFGHVYSTAGPGDAPALLVDWAGLLVGLMQAHASTAEPRYLERAVQVAAVMVDRYFDEESGGFFDIEAAEDAVGHLQVREKQLPENMTAVQGILRLYQSTRNEDYRQLCEATLSAFMPVFREHGEFAAEFGLAVDLLLEPDGRGNGRGQPPIK